MKLKKLNRNCSIVLPSVFLVVVALCSAVPVFAQGDLSRCDELKQIAVDLRSSDRATERDFLESRLSATRQALACYDGRLEVGWISWLLEKEVIDLNTLQRYSEAQTVVDRFFSTYAEQADSIDIAAFSMWDLRFKYFAGKFTEAQQSYNRGLPYASKLSNEYQKRYLLNGGSVHRAQGEFNESLNIYRETHQSFTSIPSPSDSGLFEVYGRAILGQAGSSLDLFLYTDETGIVLEKVIAQLTDAAAIFALVSSHERAAAANSSLGLAYTLSGNPHDGGIYLDLASSIAERHNLHREQIAILHRRALVSYLKKEFDAALSEIEQGLSLGRQHAIGEFDVRLHLLKGQVFEERGEPEQAMNANEDTFNAAQKSTYGRDRLLIEAVAEGVFRVRRKLPPPDNASPYLTYGLAFLVVAFFGLLAYFVWMAQRKRRRSLQAGPDGDPADRDPAGVQAETAALRKEVASVRSETVKPASPPSTPPSESTPGSLLNLDSFLPMARRLGIDDEPLLTERVAYIDRLLFEAGSVRPYIDDPILKTRMRQGLAVNIDLFKCVELLEEHFAERTFDAPPGKSVESYLRQQFKAREIPWPQTPGAWRRLLQPAT